MALTKISPDAIDLKTIGGTSIEGTGDVAFKTIGGTSVLGSGNIALGGISNVVTATTATTLTSTPTLLKITPAASGVTVTLPDATTCTLGGPLFVIENASPTYSVTLKSAGASTVAKISEGATASVSLADSSTSNGVWSVNASNTSFKVGDFIQTNRTLTAPTWLPCDGSAYLQSSYTELYAELGVLFQDSMPVANPATLPTGSGYGCSWDSSGTYLAVVHGSSPCITVYQRSGSTLTKLADPATLPTGIGYGCSWDSSGTYLAVAHSTSPFITVYIPPYDHATQFAVPRFVYSAGSTTYVRAL